VEYKPDWEKARARYEAFWNDEELERCLLWVISYRSRSQRSLLLHNPHMPNYQIEVTRDEELLRRWTDFDFLLSYHQEVFSCLYYAAEALPVFWINLGPGVMAAFLGSDPEFRKDTVWFHPSLGSLQNLAPKFNPENRWWKLTISLTAQAAKAGAGRFFVGVTDLGGAGDILAHLRGPGELCIDLMEQKEKIKEIECTIMDMWIACYEELYQLIVQRGSLVSHWLGTWAPGKHYPIQCDFSAMISPKMFQEVFVPSLCKQARYLDYPIYHLDGPGAIKHLPILLSIEEIKAIQWVPGDGAPRILNWIPLLQRIQASGRKVITYASPEEALEAIRYLEPSKTMFFIDQPLNSIEEAEGFIQSMSARCQERR